MQISRGSLIRSVGGLSFVDFQIKCTRRARFDPLSVAMNDPSEMSGSSCDGETRLKILKNPRLGAVLPSGDLFLQALAQRLGRERTAIEQNGIDAWPGAEKFCQIAGDRAVDRVRKRPFSQSGLSFARLVIENRIREKTPPGRSTRSRRGRFER